jgi:hypothetical protein
MSLVFIGVKRDCDKYGSGFAGIVVWNNVWSRSADAIAPVHHPLHQLGERSKQFNFLFLHACCFIGLLAILIQGILSVFVASVRRP